MQSASRTEVPPNFITQRLSLITRSLSTTKSTLSIPQWQIAFRNQQFSIQDCRPSRSTNSVMPQGYEPTIEHTITANASDRNTHSVSAVAIESRLGTITFITNDDGRLWRRMQTKFLWQ